MLFQVHGLAKRFGNITALADVSFHVRAGEVLGLIGPNGAGKSTLFECLAAVMPRDSGSVTSNSMPVDPAQMLFYVPDAIAPWPAQSVLWALDFTIGFFRGRAELRDRVIREMDLGPFLRQPLGTLSKGQRKRALLAIGLLAPQPVLLIDEPFDGLDLRQAREVRAALRGHAEEGRTLFLSIHQIAEAEKFCDRFVLLSNGRICGEGTAEELTALAAVGDPSKVSAGLEEAFLALT